MSAHGWHLVPAIAEFVLEGVIEPGEMADEGQSSKRIEHFSSGIFHRLGRLMLQSLTGYLTTLKKLMWDYDNMVDELDLDAEIDEMEAIILGHCPSCGYPKASLIGHAELRPLRMQRYRQSWVRPKKPMCIRELLCMSATRFSIDYRLVFDRANKLLKFINKRTDREFVRRCSETDHKTFLKSLEDGTDIVWT